MSNQPPRLLSYERRADYAFNNSDSYHGNLSRQHYDSVISLAPQRSSSFQRRPIQDDFKHNRPRRVSNSVAPITTHEQQHQSRYGDRPHEQRMLVNGVVDPEFASYEFPTRNDYGNVSSISQNAYHQHPRPVKYERNAQVNDNHYSIPNNGYYEDIDRINRPTNSDGPETDIVDDASDATASEMYQSGRFQGEVEGSSSDDMDFDDRVFLELQERENIIKKYSEGPDGKKIDDWENPDSDLFKKMDRFGFLHKTEAGLTDEERAHKLRIETEYRREKKWRTMLELWPKLRPGERPKKLEERVWKGIPSKWRMTVWPMLLDVERLKNARPNVYMDLLVRARLVSKDIKQIDLDINRTYRDHEAFRRRYDVKQQSLLNVLAAYSMYNTEVGYCQGMSQIAALFLMFLDEEDTFWCLHSLMVAPRHTMHGFFVPGFPKLTRFEVHFKKVLKKYRPRIYKHLWWFGCFLDRVPFPLALRLWDVFLIEGDCILIAMALNIMKMHEKRILKLQIDSFMEFIQLRIAEDFGFSDNETINSLRETLTKLKSDRLHIPPPSKDGDLSEVPTKALGPVLAKALGTIRDEISEIQSRHSLAISKGRSPYPARKKSKNRSDSRTPRMQHNSSAIKLAEADSDEIRLPQGNSFRGKDSFSNGNTREVPFEIPQKRASQRRQPNTPPPDPFHQKESTPSKTRNGSSSVYDSDRALLQGTSSFRDERTGLNVTIVRAAEDEEEDSLPSSSMSFNKSNAARVTHGSNNVTYISLGDDGNSVL